MPASSTYRPLERNELLALSGVLATALLINTWQIDFPLGFHPDESLKVASIRTGTQDFHHPLLLIQLARVANWIAQFETEQQVALLGRWVSALAGVALVGLTYVLARRAMSVLLALCVALGTAMTPLVAVHAHYLKEDVLLTACLLAAILAFCRFVSQPTVRTSLMLGIAAGLAFSTHYKGLLLIPAVGGALFVIHRGTDTRVGIRVLLLAATTALVTFGSVNWPLFRDPETFLQGAAFELQHSLEGHDVRTTWADNWFSFHLRNSLLPGMGAPALALGLAGLGATLVRLRRSEAQNVIVALVAAIMYVVPELSPLKPWPDYSRYMVPLVPCLLYFAGLALHEVIRDQRQIMTSVVATAMGVAIAVPAYRSVRLVSAFRNDTRVQASDWLSAQGITGALFEAYTTPSGDVDVWSVAELEPAALDRSALPFAVVSSFMFQRYLQPGAERTDSVRLFRDRYLALFRRPYVEIKPEYQSYAFSNPVLRIVEIGPPRSRSGADSGRSVADHDAR